MKQARLSEARIFSRSRSSAPVSIWSQLLVLGPLNDFRLHGGRESREVVGIAADAHHEVAVFFGVKLRRLEPGGVEDVDLRFEAAEPD